MDQFDRAQALELAERETLLSNAKERSDAANRPSLSHCQDCGDEIPLKRRVLRGVTRCVSCQTDFENNKKRGLL